MLSDSADNVFIGYAKLVLCNPRRNVTVQQTWLHTANIFKKRNFNFMFFAKSNQFRPGKTFARVVHNACFYGKFYIYVVNIAESGSHFRHVFGVQITVGL